ncbi:uncharacterized protein PV09_07912 [Verruconis gallopava]|uniref:Heterokaryon incompatibility domain-containing protein n=1 Tax=Verruconis gallopava TaxID=253628 RepID=A0A0D1YIA0_9PEZI|nr:uncharacterized protein PV09_07912 [Verruconis gallopava]KIW00557.1 hypothetical protein PV09_07912 [Verruconis gallopava]
MSDLYKPLQQGQIRLLELAPGKAEEHIVCQLRHVKLADAIPFEALSYRWSHRKQSHRIVINERPKHISHNLYSFLRHVRSPIEQRILWVDALCIDQSNFSEVDQQVQLMGTIYSTAKLVLVWLGEGSAKSGEAIEFVDSLPTKDYLIDEAINSGVIPGFTQRPWTYLAELLSLDYFERVWIIQEIALAKDVAVIDGQASTEWWKLSWAASQFRRLSDLETSATKRKILAYNMKVARSISAIASIDKARNAIYGDQRDPELLLALLARHRAAKATDHHDNIFGLYGLAPRCFEELDLLPKYDLPVDALYRQCALAILRRSRNLDILSVPRTHGLDPSSTHVLPSWVPDWSQYPYLESLLKVEYPGTRRVVRATNDSRWNPEPGSDSNLLLLEGYHVDVVTSMVFVQHDTQPSERLRSTSFVAKIKELSHDMKQHGRLDWSVDKITKARSRKPYVTDDNMMDVLCGTKCAGDWEDGWQAAKGAFDRERNAHKTERRLYPVSRVLPVYSCLAAVELTRSRRAKLTIPQARKDDLEFITYNRSIGRSIFRTRRGYIGLGPPLLNIGDKVSLCKGGKLPLILRPKKRNWELIGDCYVHGMVKGELWDEAKCEHMWIE